MQPFFTSCYILYMTVMTQLRHF